MKNSSGYNIIVLGVSCFDGMASSMRVRNLIEPLVEKDLIRVYNVIYDAKSAKDKQVKSGVDNGIGFRVIGFKIINIFSVLQFLFKGMVLIKKNKSKHLKNVLYNYDYPDAKNIFFLLFARMIGYKIVFDIVEDNRYITNYSGLMNRFRMMTSKLLLKISPYIASSYVAISSHLYEKMRLVAGSRVPVYLIPVSVNFKYFRQKSHPFNGSDIKIFYGGSYGHKDGLPYLISAFDELCNRFNNLSLILSGKGLASDMEKIFSQIEGLKNKNKIIYKGYLETDEYYKLLNECDIFCMTRVNSQYANAGFPFKLGEFLATGKAVIATSIGDIPLYLTNGQNALLIEPESVSQLVDAITFFLHNPAKVIDMGVQSRKTAENHFDSDKLSMQLLDIFKTA